MKKLVLIFILCLFSFNASSQEWVNSLSNYWEAKDIEGGIRFMERQTPTPYVLRHLASLYEIKLRDKKLSRDEQNEWAYKLRTTLIEGGEKGDICSQYIFSGPRIIDYYHNEIQGYDAKKQFENAMVKKYPQLEDIYADYTDIHWFFETKFINAIIKNEKYKNYYLKHLFPSNYEYVCKRNQKATNIDCSTTEKKYIAEAAKLGNVNALNSLWNIEIAINNKKRKRR